MRGLSLTLLTSAIAALLLVACGGPAAPATPTGPAPMASGDSALIGTWTTTITKADLEAAGLTDPGLHNENSGRFTWTFRPDGTWTQVQESLDGAPVNTPVFRGTYTATAGTFFATTEFPEQYRDEGLPFTWVVDGADLRIFVLDPPDEIMPVIVQTHPWTRAR